MQTGSSRCWCTRGSADAAPTRSRRRWRSCSWRGGREKAPAAICRKVAMAEDGPSTGSGQGGTIPVWGDGSGIRNYTYVDDLVEGICLLMQSDLEDSTNIGGEEYVTVAELVQTVIDVSGKDIHIEYVEGPVGRPCLTLRENTERPVTAAQGTNRLVGCDPQRIVAESLAILDREGKAGRMPELWDGESAKRIAAALRRRIR